MDSDAATTDNTGVAIHGMGTDQATRIQIVTTVDTDIETAATTMDTDALIVARTVHSGLESTALTETSGST